MKAPAISIRTSSASVKEELKKDLQAQGINRLGWDEKKERWISVVSAEIPIPEVRASVDSVVRVIPELNSIIGLKAMREISQWMGVTAGFEVNLSSGATPVGRLFEEYQKQFRSETAEIEEKLRDAVDELKKHRAAIASSAAADDAVKREVDEKIDAMTKAVDILNKEAAGSPAPMTRINRALDAVMKKIDPSFDSASASANAQAKAAEVQAKLDALKAERDGAVSEAGRLARLKILETQKRVAELTAKVSEKKNEAEQAYSEYTQTRMSRNTGWLGEHQIVGLIPIKYYYGLVPSEEKKGAINVTVAAAYAWSPSTEREVRALLLEDGLGTKAPEAKSKFSSYTRAFKKGELSLGDWVQQQDPLTFGPARWYVDNEGEFHVLASAVELRGQGAASDRNELLVMANANFAMLMSLDVQFRDQAQVSSDTLYDESDSELRRKASGLAKAKGSKFLRTSAVSDGDDLTLKLSDGSDSKKLRYRIISLSAKSVRDGYKAVVQQADTRSEAILASARREGSHQAALDRVKAAEAQVPAARAEGYGKGQAELAPKPTPVEARTSANTTNKTSSVDVPVGPARKQSNANVKTGIKKDGTPVPDF